MAVKLVTNCFWHKFWVVRFHGRFTTGTKLFFGADNLPLFLKQILASRFMFCFSLFVLLSLLKHFFWAQVLESLFLHVCMS